MEEEERFGGKYSEQQAREGGSERAKEAARLTDLQYLLTLVVETQRPVRLPARGSLAKLPILPTKRRPRWVNATVLAAAVAEYNS